MTFGGDFQLNVWKSDWGLPSVDVNCLKIMTCAKFSNIPVTVRATNNPFNSSNGQLPVLKNKNNTFCTVEEILEIFYPDNDTLKDDNVKLQNAETIAYHTMLEDCLYPALQYQCWVDQQNFNQVTRPWYCKALPFPLNFYYPGKYENHAKFMVEALYPDIDEKAAETMIYSKAQKCINTLSTRLGESDYYFGSSPSNLDAFVFAYLAPILKIPVPNCRLQNHLKAYGNLVKFVDRIIQKYFEADYQEYEKFKVKDQKQKAKTTQSNDIEFPNKRRNQIFAGVFAMVVMLGYALSTGIVQVQDDDYETSINFGYDEEEEEEEVDD